MPSVGMVSTNVFAAESLVDAAKKGIVAGLTNSNGAVSMERVEGTPYDSGTSTLMVRVEPAGADIGSVVGPQPKGYNMGPGVSAMEKGPVGMRLLSAAISTDARDRL